MHIICLLNYMDCAVLFHFFYKSNDFYPKKAPVNKIACGACLLLNIINKYSYVCGV